MKIFTKKIISNFLGLGTIIVLISLIVVINLFSARNLLYPEIKSREQIIPIISYTAEKTARELEIENIKKVEKFPKPVADLFITGWMSDWGLVEGYNDLVKRISTFDGISPFWFLVLGNGSLSPIYSGINVDLMNLSFDRDFELIPSIPIFNSDLMSGILKSDGNLQRHINEIVSNVLQYNYDGIDLDYEDFALEDKDKFFYFLETLNGRLKEHNKKLVFTALAKWGDNIMYPISQQTRRTLDYKKIADIVDEFRIMSYDYSSPNSAYAGPIAPLEWMEYIIQYAIYQGVPRDKLVLGIHNYAYVWTDRELLPALNFLKPNAYLNAPFDFGNKALAYNYEDVEITLQTYSVNTYFDSFWGENIARFTKEGVPRIMIYLDNHAIALRKQLAADYGLKGVAYWRLGNNGSLEM